MLAMLMTCPRPRARKRGRKVLTPFMTPSRFTSTVRRSSSADTSSQGPGRHTPALLIKTSIGPPRDSTRLATRSQRGEIPNVEDVGFDLRELAAKLQEPLLVDVDGHDPVPSRGAEPHDRRPNSFRGARDQHAFHRTLLEDRRPDVGPLAPDHHGLAVRIHRDAAARSFALAEYGPPLRRSVHSTIPAHRGSEPFEPAALEFWHPASAWRSSAAARCATAKGPSDRRSSCSSDRTQRIGRLGVRARSGPAGPSHRGNSGSPRRTAGRRSRTNRRWTSALAPTPSKSRALLRDSIFVAFRARGRPRSPPRGASWWRRSLWRLPTASVIRKLFASKIASAWRGSSVPGSSPCVFGRQPAS